MSSPSWTSSIFNVLFCAWLNYGVDAMYMTDELKNVLLTRYWWMKYFTRRFSRTSCGVTWYVDTTQVSFLCNVWCVLSLVMLLRGCQNINFSQVNQLSYTAVVRCKWDILQLLIRTFTGVKSAISRLHHIWSRIYFGLVSLSCYHYRLQCVDSFW